jgi:two-component system, cell cycle sensor histidine kinase and response regulator CckA
MSSPTRHPRARLVRLIALLFLPLGLVATAVLITLPHRMNDLALSSAEERARGLAEVMASLVGPDIEFDDREHAGEALARLSVEPDLISAELFGGDGQLFARWPLSDAPPSSPPHAQEELTRTHVSVDQERIEVCSSVRAPGGTRGVLRLRFATSAIDDKRRANMTAAGLAAAVVALVGLFFSVVTARFLVRRQAAEEALRRSGESYAALSDALPVALILHHDDRILYINPAGVKLLGGDETRSLVGGSLAAQLAPGEMLPASNGEARVHLDARTLALATGKVLSVEATSLAVQFGERDAAALVALDVTERTRLQERLLLSDRMASLGTLAAGVAHEINNPLAVVIANVDYVRDAIGHRPAPAGDDTDAALSEALDAAHRVGRIVRDMKTLSRSDGDAQAPTDLNQVVEKSLQMVQGHLKHRAQIVSNLGAIPPVMGNESRLVQVFVNLLINAAQALPEGKAQENRVEVATALAADGGVVATVRDTGCGIPAATRDRIFDPFFTTKPVGVGTGLGLAIVHNLVHAMGGRIELDSIENVGTTFTIHLHSTSAAPRRRGDSGAVPIGGRGRVLVIDDEPSVVAAVERLLADSHTVSGVQSARTALERFGRGESFDLILCDLRMPDMSGIELARQLDERYPHLRRRLVFMTGDIGEAGMTGPGDARIDPASIAPVLEKPFSRKELLRFVRENLRRPGSDGAPQA